MTYLANHLLRGLLTFSATSGTKNGNQISERTRIKGNALKKHQVKVCSSKACTHY